MAMGVLVPHGYGVLILCGYGNPGTSWLWDSNGYGGPGAPYLWGSQFSVAMEVLVPHGYGVLMAMGIMVPHGYGVPNSL